MSRDNGATFESLNCLSIDLKFEVAHDKFRTAKFVEDMKLERGVAYCASLDRDKSDYHVHFNWDTEEPEGVELNIVYHIPSAAPEPDEAEPYAETIIEWLGKYFENESAYATVLASFSYDLAARTSRFPLPIRLNAIPDVETEIDGVSFNLPLKPGGIDGVFLMKGLTRLSVRARGGTRIKFADFNVLNLVSELSNLIIGFTEPSKTREEAKA